MLIPGHASLQGTCYPLPINKQVTTSERGSPPIMSGLLEYWPQGVFVLLLLLSICCSNPQQCGSSAGTGQTIISIISQAVQREREKKSVTTSIQAAMAYATNLISCLGLCGGCRNESRGSLLFLAPQHQKALRSPSEDHQDAGSQKRSGAQCAPRQLSRHTWPCKPALLNVQQIEPPKMK